MRPNVLLLHCHDVGRFLGCYGVPTVATPHLDRLAGDGVRFARAFATAPQCSPSRASLFTGRWPHSNGVLGLTHKEFAWDLHPEERHLAAYLREAGYTTTLLGVHHESRVRPDQELAERLGFDEVVTGGMAHDVAARAVERLSMLATSQAPFYLQVGFHEPHRISGTRDPEGTMGFIGDHVPLDETEPVTIPPYLIDDPGARREVAELQAATSYMDQGVGRVLSALASLGLESETLVIFTTDHGVALPRAKCTLYDPGLEVALMLRWPGRGWTGGVVRDELVSNLDVLPTLLSALDIEVPAQVQGRSFAPLLDGSGPRAQQGVESVGAIRGVWPVGGAGAVGAYEPRDRVFGELTYHDYYDPRRCVRTESYKLIANFSAAPDFMDSSQSWRRRSMPVTDPIASHPPVELYDLDADPHELNDLADDPAYKDVRDELLASLSTWMRDTGDPLLAGAVTSPLHTKTVGFLPT